MIARIWHGYTSLENATIYENMLKTEIIPEIEAKNLKGYKGFQMLRRELETETEFTTLIWFNSIENVKEFVGDDPGQVYIPEKARQILSRFDSRAVHSELRLDNWKE